MSINQDFQTTPGTVAWCVHFHSSVEKVFWFLSTDEGRKKFWAESADEKDGRIHYVFLNNIESHGEILERVPGERFKVTYFDWLVTFSLRDDGNGGTDMTMTCEAVPEHEKTEAVAGWVSWLLTMKAAVDFDVDLRNHDTSRTWYDGYVDP